MKLVKYSLFFSICFLLINCKSEKKEVIINSFMVGKWQTKSISIKFPTHKSSDSTHVMREVFTQTSDKLPQSEYFNNGTFNAWFLDINDEKLEMTSGKWSIQNDTLFTMYTYLGKEISPQYTVKESKGTLKLSSIYDWDEDGVKDDVLYMISKKID